MNAILTSPALKKLIGLLNELFQLNQPDLDFGIYRIMHANAEKINEFLETTLPQQTREELEKLNSTEYTDLKRALEIASKGATDAGFSPADSPRVQEINAKLRLHGDIESMELEIYDHLFTFFSRYYHEGDFLSRPVYKAGVYAIPYNGEEVALHWANKDQYYIKTSENFRDYAFVLSPQTPQDPKRVHFRIVDAEEGAHNNVRETKERRFVLFAPMPLMVEGNELIIQFTYAPHADNQKDLNNQAINALLANADSPFSTWISALKEKHINADNTPSEKSKLEVHLSRYTAKNSFDYFIHKNLGGFLRRELDFYIKNEVLHLDNIANESSNRFDQVLTKIRVLRGIAEKLIVFLAQLEDFQKKLWEKKKFVVDCDYCVRVDLIADDLLQTAINNPAQVEEWIQLYAINALPEEGGRLIESSPAWSNPPSLAYIKTLPTLMVDTRHFSRDYRDRLIASLSKNHALDEITDGEMFHSENFQALNLMQEKYRERIDCIHIDPPYNTATSGFLYKNNYQHSSWLSLMIDRALNGISLLNDNGSFVCHIDENEYERLKISLINLMPYDSGTIVWDKRNPMGGGGGIALQHEYVIWLSNNQKQLIFNGEAIESILSSAKMLIKKYRGINEESRTAFASWINSNNQLSGGEKAYRLIDDSGNVYRAVSLRAPEPRIDQKFHLPLIHPRTNKPCPVPPNGFSRTPETLAKMINEGMILFGDDETTQPNQKAILHGDKRRQLTSVIQDAMKGKSYLDALGLDFPYCHPVSVYSTLIYAGCVEENDICLDYHAGSGTTGHAVINLNREDGGTRKFILVEMGDYFHTVTLPRIKKVSFSPEWKDGKPKRLATDEEAQRSPRLIKTLRLESYEDTLNHLAHRDINPQSTTQQTTIGESLAEADPAFREEYLLRYWLDTEHRESILAIDQFRAPEDYRINIKDPQNEGTIAQRIDLVESFNWLLGLEVVASSAWQGFSARCVPVEDADLPADTPRRLILQGALTTDPQSPWKFRTVTGTNRLGQKVLIIWRTLTDDIVQDNLILGEWFRLHHYSAQECAYPLIYVNGTNNLENLKNSEQDWQVKLIEEAFHATMFAGINA